MRTRALQSVNTSTNSLSKENKKNMPTTIIRSEFAIEKCLYSLYTPNGLVCSCHVYYTQFNCPREKPSSCWTLNIVRQNTTYSTLTPSASLMILAWQPVHVYIIPPSPVSPVRKSTNTENGCQNPSEVGLSGTKLYYLHFAYSTSVFCFFYNRD